MKMKALTMTFMFATVLCTACGTSHYGDIDVPVKQNATTTTKMEAREIVLIDAETKWKIMTERKPNALQYEIEGVYNSNGSNSDGTTVYYFSGDNAFYKVITGSGGHYTTCVHDSGDTGVVFWNTYYGDGEFAGMTNNYCLYKDSDGKIIAVSLESEVTKVGRAYEVRPFSKLDIAEKKSAVYPIMSQEDT